MDSQHTPQTVTDCSYTMDDWRGGYQSLYHEYAYWIDEIEGTIPASLEGTLFRNGPGLFEINGQPIQHPFDGDGMVCAITFTNGKAHFRNRFVKTKGFVAEQKAGRILYRGVFGTQRPGGFVGNMLDLELKNVANTNIVYWGGKLLALWEAGEPYRLDPATLETLGLDKMGGKLSPGNEFAAHPHIDPSCPADDGASRLVNFAVNPGLSTVITIYEINARGDFVQRHAYRFPEFLFIHDFILTPNYCIFVQNPVQYSPVPYLFGCCAAAQCFTLDTRKSLNMIFIPRDPDGEVKILSHTMPPVFIFHHVNGFEQGDEIYVDSICYDHFPIVVPEDDFRNINFETYPRGELYRFTLNLKTQKVQHQLIEHRSCEFPVVHPNYEGRPYRYVYLSAAHQEVCNAPHQAILKRDMHTNETWLWSDAPRGFVGEPVFVPRPDGTAEDDGWLLVLVYDATHQRSDVVILDAADVAQGAIARLHLKHHVPYGLHGCFVDEVFL